MDPRIATSLDELGTEDRAIVELAEVRGIGDAEIAGYLGVDAHEAKRRRRAALGRLADGLGVSREAARAALASALPPGEANGARRPPGRAGAAWTTLPTAREPRAGAPAGPRPMESAPTCGPARQAPVPPAPEPSPPTRRRGRGLALALVAVLLVAGIAAAGLSTEDSDPGQPAGAAVAGRTPAPAEVRLEPLPGASGTATARLSDDGRRLAVIAAELPDPGEGRYAVWLYASLTSTRLLASAAGGDFEVRAPLPREWRDYRLVDVSLEPPDGVRGHSGESVLRAEVAELERAVDGR